VNFQLIFDKYSLKIEEQIAFTFEKQYFTDV